MKLNIEFDFSPESWEALESLIPKSKRGNIENEIKKRLWRGAIIAIDKLLAKKNIQMFGEWEDE